MTGPRVIPARAPCARASPTRPRRAARTSRGVATRALPPANEVAGFVIGGGLVALVLSINKLDAVIARAQVRGFEESSGKKGTTRSPSGGGGGNIFVVPDDDDDDDDDDDARTP